MSSTGIRTLCSKGKRSSPLAVLKSALRRASHDSMSLGRFHLCVIANAVYNSLGAGVPPPTFQAAGRLRKGRSGLGFRVGSDPQVEITREMAAAKTFHR